MKLVFPCFVVSVAVLIAVFGCKWTRQKATEHVEPPRGNGPNTVGGKIVNVGATGSREDGPKTVQWAKTVLHRAPLDEKNKQPAYFIRKRGDKSEFFKTKIIATPAMFIVKKRYKKEITYDDANSLQLDLSEMHKPEIHPVRGYISDVMLANNKFYASDVLDNIALIKLTSEKYVKYTEEPDFVKKNLNWIYQNFDRVQHAKSQSDLIQEMKNDDVEITRGDHGLLIRKTDQKTCGVYVVRIKYPEGQVAAISPIFATRASCIVKGHNGKDFEYYPRKELQLKIRSGTFDGEYAFSDTNDFIANKDFKFGQEGFKNDIALGVLKTTLVNLEYSNRPDYFSENRKWIADTLIDFFKQEKVYLADD